MRHNGPQDGIRAETCCADSRGEHQLVVLEVHLHLPVVRVVEEPSPLFRFSGALFRFRAFTHKASLKFFARNLSEDRGLATVEVTKTVDESPLDTFEDRVMPPGVTALLQSKSTIY